MGLSISLEFDRVLREQNWNLTPQAERIFPTSTNSIFNAATAIAICAYPQQDKLKWGGKGHKYQQALLAYAIRAAQWTGHLAQLPPWVHRLKTDRMWERLATGHRNLARSFVVRDLITAALIEKAQTELGKNEVRSTFQISFSPNLRAIEIQFPIRETQEGYAISGKIPEKRWSSLRSAIRRFRPALAEFEGPSPRIEGSDEEYFYQNTLTRLVKPALQTSHIMQIVWEAATNYREESIERRLPIDQILMRKGNWATDLDKKAAASAGMAIFTMRNLGVASCSCKLIQLAPPSPDS
jgi:hypothetical protein